MGWVPKIKKIVEQVDQTFLCPLDKIDASRGDEE
jgi:hypothetical protein